MANNGGYWTPAIQSYAYNRLRTEAGLTDAGARGLLSRWMNVEAPDGPVSVNPTSGAQGIGQWLGSRLSGIAGNTNLEDQLSYAIDELNGPESKAGNALRAATTEAQGATGASMYERAAGYNSATGSDDFTDMTQRKMASVAIPQYDAAGNPISAIQAQAPSPQAAPGTATQPAPAQSGPSDDDLISKFLGPSAAPANTNVSPATGDRASELRAATGAPALTDDDLLAKYLGPATATNDNDTSSTSAAPATTDASASPSLLGSLGQTIGNASNAFQQATMGNMLGIGPLVDNAVDFVGSNIASAITGKPVNQLIAAAHDREQQIADASPIGTGAGDVVGAVLPFTAVGPTGMASKLLGTAGSYGAGPVGDAALRGLAGAGSSAALAGADTAERGGDPEQIKQNMLGAGLVGAVAAPALHVAGNLIGKGIQAFAGPSAPKMLANALVADQNAPDAVNQLLQNHGPGATVADLGPNTQGLAAGLASLPGDAKSIVVNNLMQRAAGAGNRLAADVANTIGAGQPIGALTDQIIAGQKAAAAPLYDAVRNVPVQSTPEIQALVQRPAIQSAIEQAKVMMQNDGVQPSSTVQLYDFAKQILDDKASAAIRTGDDNAARQFTGLSGQLRSAIDAQVPQYAAARAAFAGPAKVLDAVTAGQKVFSSATAPEDVRAAMASMSPSEKDGYLAGAQAAVQKMIGTARTDAQGVKNAFQSSYAKEKLAALVGQPQADQIASALDREAGYAATSGKAYNNSISSANLAQQQVLSPKLAAFPGQSPPQTFQGAILAGFGKARSALTAVYRNAQNKELANMLTQGPLSPEQSAGVAAASRPGAGIVPGAAVALGAQNSGLNNPLLGGFAGAPDMVFRNGRWIPRIVVRGANPILAQ